jgi:tRNA-Thr(GGU) m(6)t(6)A37 methyltransferase TsaA
MPDQRELALRPIGRVTQGRSRPGQAGRGPPRAPEAAAAEIELDETWAEALQGLEDFSHAWVIWWLEPLEGRSTPVRVRPEGRADMPLVGLFATRSPLRPCPIAITAVQVLSREGARLRVQGLDAYEGSFVLDIKPYLRRGDLIPEATAPEWLVRLWQIHDQEHGDRP